MAIKSKHLNSTFVEENANVNEENAVRLIVEATQEIASLKSQMKGDERLDAAKQIVKDLRESYTSSIKYAQAKVKYLLDKLEDLEDEGENANPNSSLNEPTL